MLGHSRYPIKRFVKILFIDYPHQIKVERVFRAGLVIQSTAVNAKQFTLSNHAQIRIFPLDHHSLFFKPKTYNSFFFNQSFSIFN